MSSIWDLTKDAARCEINIGSKSQFGHHFGGTPTHAGVIPSEGSHPIQLVMTLDLADPKVSFRQAGLRTLPLYYPFQYNASDLWYRVVNDDEIHIERPLRGAFQADFPYENYPASFSKAPIALSEPRSIDELFAEELPQEVWDMRVEEMEIDRPPDQLEKISVIDGLFQDAPNTKCVNTACQRQDMSLLAIIQRNPELQLWSASDGDDPDVIITYEYCPRCYLIYTTNQCG